MNVGSGGAEMNVYYGRSRGESCSSASNKSVLSPSRLLLGGCLLSSWCSVVLFK